MSNAPAIGIMGLGLIGGSAARAFRRAGYSVRGYDVDRVTMDQASADGVIDNAPADDWSTWADAVDWVIMAVPLVQFGACLGDWTRVVARPQIIIDVSSVKAPVVPVLSSMPARFTPLCLHPMAGREVAGYQASGPDLFAGRVCAVVPIPGREPAPLPVVDQILTVLAMHPWALDAEIHDQVVALISHLPYVISAALLCAAEKDGERMGAWQRMVGPGFMDTSRVGSSSPRLWQEIVGANREALMPVLETYIDVLNGWLADLGEGRSLAGLNRAPEIRALVLERGEACD